MPTSSIEEKPRIGDSERAHYEQSQEIFRIICVYSIVLVLESARPALLSCADRGTCGLMARSYVGTISRRGLESLLPETEHAVPFLIRRAYRRRPTEAVCYWAVMDDTTARDVEEQLRWQWYEEALLTLQVRAMDIGTILPPYAEDAA